MNSAGPATSNPAILAQSAEKIRLVLGIAGGGAPSFAEISDQLASLVILNVKGLGTVALILTDLLPGGTYRSRVRVGFDIPESTDL
jgi:hypothetical protein